MISQSWATTSQKGAVELTLVGERRATLLLRIEEFHSSASWDGPATQSYQRREVVWKGHYSLSAKGLRVQMTERERGTCSNPHPPCQVAKRSPAATSLVLVCQRTTAQVHPARRRANPTAKPTAKPTATPTLRCTPENLVLPRAGEDIGDLLADLAQAWPSP